MDKQLRRLETFTAHGSDGSLYTVHGFEHLAHVGTLTGGQEQWEPTGQVEYKLDTGEMVQVHRDGRMELADGRISLEREALNS